MSPEAERSGTGTLSSALMRGSSSAMTSGDAELPVSVLNLMPLKRYGLWLAVTTAAAVALRSMTLHHATWGGHGRAKLGLPSPEAAKTSATGRAKSSAANRQSDPPTASGAGAHES